MSKKNDRLMQKVAALACHRKVQEEIGKSPTLKAKLVGPEYINFMQRQHGLAFTQLKRKWEGTPAPDRSGLRENWIAFLKAHDHGKV